jgi:hypothetical protein
MTSGVYAKARVTEDHLGVLITAKVIRPSFQPHSVCLVYSFPRAALTITTNFVVLNNRNILSQC